MAAKKSGKKRFSGFWVNGGLIIICLLWTIPTLGLLISSFRDRVDINRTGWWTVLPHQDWVALEQIKPAPDIDRSQPMSLAGVTATFEEFRNGIEKDGRRYIWIGNRRVGYLEVQEQKITAVCYAGKL
jgi:alpha-glucoside transport system permease protein